jgi:LacI family transcriptional regulator
VARVTIKDIALAANVSPMTVSNVINARASKASPETIVRINEAIRTLGYQPNLSARALASNASRLIGVVVPFTEDQNQLLLDNPFYAEVVSGIESALRARGYFMMLSGLGETSNEVDALAQWNVDALIAIGIYREGLFERLRKRHLPTLLVDSYLTDDHVHHLRVADDQAARRATEHLIAHGHRRIALVTGAVRDGGVIEQRLAGYRLALDAAGIAFDPDLVLAGSVTFDWGIDAADQLVARRATAAFCTADLIAAGVLTGLHQRNIDIPGDVSVLGFDNLPVSRMVYPALSTVDQTILAKGKLAGDIVLDMLEGRKPPRETLLDARIIERQSVGPVPK